MGFNKVYYEVCLTVTGNNTVHEHAIEDARAKLEYVIRHDILPSFRPGEHIDVKFIKQEMV